MFLFPIQTCYFTQPIINSLTMHNQLSLTAYNRQSVALIMVFITISDMNYKLYFYSHFLKELFNQSSSGKKECYIENEIKRLTNSKINNCFI